MKQPTINIAMPTHNGGIMLCMTFLLSVRVPRGATMNKAPDGGLESDVLDCNTFVGIATLLIH